MDESPQTEALIDYTEWLENLRAQVIESVNGVALRGARPVLVGNAGRLATSPTSIVGFALRETSGVASATVVLRDGFDAGGDPILPITLAPGESVRDWFGPAGVNLSIGLYVTVTGAVDGSIWLRGTQ